MIYMIHHFVLVVAYWSSNSLLYHGPQNPFSTQKLGYLRIEWWKFAASKLETTQAIWIAAELLALAKESGCGSSLGAMVLGMGRWLQKHRKPMAQISPRVKSLQFLHPPFHPSTIMDMKHGKHDPFVKDSTHHHTNIYQPSPENHLRSWKVCFVIRGISHVSSPYWAVDINLTWSWNLDLAYLVKIHRFLLKVLWGWKVLQLVRIGMTWLVAAWISCMFTGRFEWIRERCMASSCVTSWIKWPHDVSWSLHLGVRKLLEDMDRRLGPSVTWCCKGSQGMVGWITWAWGKPEIHLTFAASKMPFCWFPTKQRSELKTCPCDTMLSGIGASEVITYSAAMNSLSKTGDWAMATGLLRQLDSELSMNGKDMMTWWHSGRPHDSGGSYRELYLPIEV